MIAWTLLALFLFNPAFADTAGPCNPTQGTTAPQAADLTETSFAVKKNLLAQDISSFCTETRLDELRREHPGVFENSPEGLEKSAAQLAEYLTPWEASEWPFESVRMVGLTHNKIGEACFFGVNSTVGNNIKVGRDSLVGAGALLVKDAPEASLFKGPATFPDPESTHKRFLK